MSNEPTSPSAREISEACLCFHTQRAARALARRFDAAFRGLGITNGQFSLMTMLSGAEHRRMSETAAFLMMDRTTLTAAIKALERKGLVVVALDPKDRRGRLISLTDLGRSTLEAAKPIWYDEHARLERESAGLDAPHLRAQLKTLA